MKILVKPLSRKQLIAQLGESLAKELLKVTKDYAKDLDKGESIKDFLLSGEENLFHYFFEEGNIGNNIMEAAEKAYKRLVAAEFKKK